MIFKHCASISSFFSFSSFDREALGKISEKQFVALLKSKDDIPDEDIQEMLEEYYRIAKLKGITTDKPDPPSDSSDDEDDDDEEGGANPPPPPPPTRPTVKSPPTTKRAGGPGKNSSIKSPTKSQTATIPEDEKWIDYRGTKKQKKITGGKIPHFIQKYTKLKSDKIHSNWPFADFKSS